MIDSSAMIYYQPLAIYLSFFFQIYKNTFWWGGDNNGLIVTNLINYPLAGGIKVD